jgi:hypothetical protein
MHYNSIQFHTLTYEVSNRNLLELNSNSRLDLNSYAQNIWRKYSICQEVYVPQALLISLNVLHNPAISYLNLLP